MTPLVLANADTIQVVFIGIVLLAGYVVLAAIWFFFFRGK